MCCALVRSAICNHTVSEVSEADATSRAQVLRAGGSGSVFGFGPAGATVAVRLINAGGHFVKSANTKVGATGQWRVRLGKLRVGPCAALSSLLQASQPCACRGTPATLPCPAQPLHADNGPRRQCALCAVQAGSPFALSAQVGSTRVLARNIAVGHVILASGQSNMFISLADIRAKYPGSNWAALAQRSIANAPKNKAVRLFKVSAL
jgi:hypothetical protein